jgi:hypothetical protein
MVALDPLLQVLGDIVERILRQEPVFPGGRNGRRVGAGPVRADPVGSQQGLILQHLAEEALGCPQVARGGEQKIDRRAVFVDGPVQVAPLAADLDVRLVNANRPAMRLAKELQPALDQRRIGQDPTVQGGMVHRQPRSRNSSSMSRQLSG